MFDLPERDPETLLQSCQYALINLIRLIVDCCSIYSLTGFLKWLQFTNSSVSIRARADSNIGRHKTNNSHAMIFDRETGVVQRLQS